MDRPAPLILLIEDEPQMRRFLRTALGANDYRLVEAVTAKEGLAQAAARNPDVILLDLGLPDRDGLEVARELREWSGTPIIILSARGRERDKVAALDVGADDYLTKPFGVEELLARIRVALRHAARSPGAAPEPIFEVGDLRVDLPARRVWRAGAEVHLTPTEYKLLVTLVRHAGKVLTHRQLLKEVWGTNYVNQSHYVRVYLAQLRQKIEADPARPRLLLTEPGVGYRLKDE
jgi:two-component system KDP operon response regulator KdpE